ncbi:C21orf2 (predicted), partial [Pycnogonum litorale]
MMTTLTESIVLSRTRASDLSSVRKLNCWGSELCNVSLLRTMKNVEVLSLSVNKITSLADFAHCPKLQELYIRKNEIQDLNHICHLKNLVHLKSLWLADNPCSAADNYRLTVLRTLPNLQKLDNQAVKPEEIHDAMLYGNVLDQPGSQKMSERREPSPVRSSSPQQNNVHESSPVVGKSEKGFDLDAEPVRDENKNISGTNHGELNSSSNEPSLFQRVSPIQRQQASPPYTQYAGVRRLPSPQRNVANTSEQAHESENPNQPQAFQAKVQTLVEHSKLPGHQQAQVEQESSSPQDHHRGSLANQHHSLDSVIHTCYEQNSSSPGENHRHSVTFPTSHAVSHVGIPRSHSSGDRTSPTRVFSVRGKNR